MSGSPSFSLLRTFFLPAPQIYYSQRVVEDRVKNPHGEEAEVRRDYAPTLPHLACLAFFSCSLGNRLAHDRHFFRNFVPLHVLMPVVAHRCRILSTLSSIPLAAHLSSSILTRQFIGGTFLHPFQFVCSKMSLPACDFPGRIALPAWNVSHERGHQDALVVAVLRAREPKRRLLFCPRSMFTKTSVFTSFDSRLSLPFPFIFRAGLLLAGGDTEPGNRDSS